MKRISFRSSTPGILERVVRFGRAAEEILVESDVWEADLVVLVGAPDGWIRRPGVRKVARAVLRRASVPVVVCRPPSPSLAVRFGQRLQSLFCMVGRW
jgi:nucleotide-binding universal stress UspA family protein